MPLPTKIKDLIPLLDLIPHPEGGFFVETYRSGCVPMTTMGQSGYDCDDKDLVVTNGRASNREDVDQRRNCLTSIFWAPTVKSPRLVVATNTSDHMHYYHGGRPFKYCLYDPIAGEYSEHILGPDLHKGHKLQLVVRGGVWKCGMMDLNSNNDGNGDYGDYDYSLIGEGVGPGWDAADFEFVTEEMVQDRFGNNKNKKLFALFCFFLHEQSTEVQSRGKTSEYYQEFYVEGEIQNKRILQRA